MITARIPTSMDSIPSVGPIKRISNTERGIGKAPSEITFASRMASSWLKLPEISARPPAIGSLITGFDTTLSPQTIDRLRPRFCEVKSKNFYAPLGVNVKLTIHP